MNWLKKIFGIGSKSAEEEALAWAHEETMKHYRSLQTGVKSDAAQLALRQPPNCIAAFAVQSQKHSGDLDICARFALSCRHCSSKMFKVFCYPDSSELEGEEEVLEQDPHHVLCSGCGARELLFDHQLHGYNAAVVDSESDDPIPDDLDTVERPIQVHEETYLVHVIFTYNNSLDELRETGAEWGVPPQDLFDWFHVVAVSVTGEELKDINYECA